MPHLFSELEKEPSLRQLRRSLISRFYPLSEEAILRFREHLDFSSNGLAKNECITWSQNLFREVKDQLDWKDVWLLKTLRVDLAFLIEFEDEFDFSVLSRFQNLEITDGIIELFGNRIVWKPRLFNSGALSSIPKIDRVKENLDWKLFSCSYKSDFSDEIMDYFSDYWDYKTLSSNVHLPASTDFLKKYGDKLDFDILSRNPAFFPLIMKYPESKMWNWKRVLHNPAYEYSDDTFGDAMAHFIKAFPSPAFVRQSKNKNLLETRALITYLFHSHRTDLTYFLQNKFIPFLGWKAISACCNTPFPKQFLDDYWQHIDFSQPNAIKCAAHWITEEFLHSHLEIFNKKSHYFYRLPLRQRMLKDMPEEIEWNWLSTATQFDWSWDFIREHWEKLNPYQLSQNEGIYEQLVVPEIEEFGLDGFFEVT